MNAYEKFIKNQEHHVCGYYSICNKDGCPCQIKCEEFSQKRWNKLSEEYIRDLSDIVIDLVADTNIDELPYEITNEIIKISKLIKELKGDIV